jgi:plastocyanin
VASDDAGSGASSDGNGEFTIAVDDATPAIDLAATKVINVTVTPHGESGAVALSVTGLPSDVTAAFDNPTVNVTGTAPATAKLTLTSVDSSKPVATPLQVVGTSGATTESVGVTLTVSSFITINIPVNADAQKTSFGTVNITAPADIAANPLTVNFVNLDSTPHEIHADNPKQGFSHGKGTFGQGQADAPVRKVTVAGTYSWHLHDDAPPGGPPGGTVVIK